MRDDLIFKGTHQGITYEVHIMSVDSGHFHATSYAVLPNSHIVQDHALGYPSLREGDRVGFDTAHGWTHGLFNPEGPLYLQSGAHIAEALRRIMTAIDVYKSLFKSDEED